MNMYMYAVYMYIFECAMCACTCCLKPYAQWFKELLHRCCDALIHVHVGSAHVASGLYYTVHVHSTFVSKNV